MKLLVLLPRVPYPLEKGDKLRAYNQIKCLSKNNEIILCALTDRPVHPEAMKNLMPYCKVIYVLKLSKTGILFNLFKAFLKGIPFQTGYFYNTKIHKKLDQIIEKEKPDHIYCQLLRVAEYMIDQSIPKTLDYQDVFSKGIERRIHKSPFYLKPLLKLEYKRLLRYENRVFNHFDNKTIISKPDRDFIPHLMRERIHVIPNGVDFSFFKPMIREKDVQLVFTGNMGYPPNVNAAEFLVREILPLVHQKKPGVKVLLAGASPDNRVLALKSDKVEVTGWVDDIRECYARAEIFIAPMQIGTGLQNKLLEAMAMNLPCITSPLANEALHAKNGVEILVGNDPAEYALYILHLLEDKNFSDSIAKEGNKFVRSNYDWEIATGALDRIIKGL